MNRLADDPTYAWLAALESKAAGPAPIGGLGYGYGYGYGPNDWGGSRHVASRADVPTYLNVVVAICLGWLERNFPVADLRVLRVGGARAGEAVDGHPAVALLDRPSPLDDFHSFWQSFLVSDVCDGNTFFLKVRNRMGLHSLWWAPPWDVTVEPNRDGASSADSPVAGYRVRIDGEDRAFPPEDVVHIKDGRDPADPLRGLSKLKAGLRSISAIDNAELYTQMLMINCGAVPCMVSPSNPDQELQPENVSMLRAQYGENQTQFSNGRPFFSTQGLKVEHLGLTPEEMALDKIREFPVAAICALIGTPAMAVGLPDPGKTYSNLQEATRNAWHNGLIPRQSRAAESFDRQCPELIDRRGERLAWDYAAVQALKEDEKEKIARLILATGGPVMLRNEARESLGLEAIEDGPGVADVAATALNGAQVTSLVEIANAVASGMLPPESARALIAASFPNLTADQVDAIVAPLVDFEPPPPPAPPPGRFPPARPPLGLPKPDDEDKAAVSPIGEKREDGPRPFGVLFKDDMPPLVEGDRPDPHEDNTFGLPDGEPLAEALRKVFGVQARAVLGEIPTVGVDIPAAFPPLSDYDDPMAAAMTPILSMYWQAAGETTLAKLGLDPDDWRVTDPNTAAAIEAQALDFCASTNETTARRLDDALQGLREELRQGIVEEGETVRELRKRVQSIFTGLIDQHAETIARTETARAVHAASLQSAIESEVVESKRWLLSANSCPLCVRLAEEAKEGIPLDASFGSVGNHPTYSDVKMPPAHPSCRCSWEAVLSQEYRDIIAASTGSPAPESVAPMDPAGAGIERIKQPAGARP